ncbi:hypothetical protein GQ55_8G254000 [Panicum hallii var. hallii]|uniref:Uncharacterized protein n=1 Tax=Panicum hallii var. hallii TaxID=1504633 RepID=A0A2T7CR47_9POAL|nr:hypothetical protein GQ55_8G254000 [Panicum hallii var. hallii]
MAAVRLPCLVCHNLFEKMYVWLVAYMYRRLLLYCVQEKLYSNEITVACQEMVKEHVDQVEQRVWTKAAGILHFRQKRAPGLQRQAIGRGREQCQKAKDKESLELGAATAVVALAVLLGWLCLPQEAKHPGNVRFIVSLLLSFATFLSGNALMLLSLNLLGRLREDLVSGSQRAASKCTLLLVACAVLSVLTLLSVMVELLPGRVYRYIGLAVVVAVLPPAAGAHWYLRRRAGGGGVEAACAEDREELDAASKITSSVTNSAFGGLIGVLFSASKASSAVSRAAYVSIFLVFATSISGMLVMTVSKKVPEITNLRFRRFLVAAIKLANCVLLACWPRRPSPRPSWDNNPREQENQEARVKAVEDHASKVTTATMGAIMSVFGGALGEKGGHDMAVAMDAFMVVLTSAFVSGFGFLLLAAAPVPARACLAPAARVLTWSSIALFAATAVAAYGAEVWRS